MLDSLLADTMEPTNSDLDERIRTNELERRRLDAEHSALIAVAEHRRLFDDDGHRSMSAYRRATLNCSSGETSRLRARHERSIESTGSARPEPPFPTTTPTNTPPTRSPTSNNASETE